MASRRFANKPPADLSSERGPEDGIDPRLEPKYPRGKVSNRKALQLCRQVERALSIALEGEILRDLTVQSVMPAPDSSRLLVTFMFHGDAGIATADVLAAIQKQRARLRAEVAAGIHRKKTPDLAFHVARG